jgi:hypothetical protein
MGRGGIQTTWQVAIFPTGKDFSSTRMPRHASEAPLAVVRPSRKVESRSLTASIRTCVSPALLSQSAAPLTVVLRKLNPCSHMESFVPKPPTWLSTAPVWGQRWGEPVGGEDSGPFPETGGGHQAEHQVSTPL